MAENYFVLSLDGGGIRGVFTARLLERLEEQVPGFLAKVDLFAGNSTGGILALALASKIPPGRLIQLYRDEGRKIFSRPWYRALFTLGGLTAPKYSNEGLKAALTAVFGETRLGGLPHRVVAVSFDLDNHEPEPTLGPRMAKAKIFHNYPGDKDCAERVLDVALATSAAPTFFKSHNGFVDGGVVANNPTMCGIAQAIDAGTGGQKLEALRVLSLGTGLSPHHIEGKEDAGVIGWGSELVNLWIDGVAGVAHYQAQRILGNRYRRLDGIFPESVGLDDVSKVGYLLEAADKVDLGSTVAWLRVHLSP